MEKLKKYAKMMIDEKGECKEMEIVFDFINEIVTDMYTPIKTKMLLLK